jgi:hypothetical protein
MLKGNRRMVMAAVIAAAGTAVVVACGESTPAGPSRSVVTYRLDTTGGAATDSVAYDNGHGVLIKVSRPAVGWTLSFGVDFGGSVEAYAWGLGAAASSAKLKVSWTGSVAGEHGDSSHVTFTAPSHFALHVAHRII